MDLLGIAFRLLVLYIVNDGFLEMVFNVKHKRYRLKTCVVDAYQC